MTSAALQWAAAQATVPPSMKVLLGQEDFVEIKPNGSSNVRYDRVYWSGDKYGIVEGIEATEDSEPAIGEVPKGTVDIVLIAVNPGTTAITNKDLRFPKNTGGHPAVTGFVLDPEDPFEGLLVEVVELQRRKRSDYASEEDIYANFRANAAMMQLPGYGPKEDCMSMVTRKIGRITNLTKKGAEPQNESLIDSYLDLFIYAGLLYGLALEEADALR